MKNILFYIICIPLFAASCKEDETDGNYGNFRLDMVTYIKTDGLPTFSRDDGVTLYGISGKTPDNLEDGQRIMLNYVPQEDVTLKRQNITIRNISKILYGYAEFKSSTDLEEMANDSIYISSLWYGGNCINLQYKIEYRNTPHSIGLYLNPEQQNPDGTSANDTVYLELRHNTNNDSPGYLVKGYASFRIESLLNIFYSNKSVIKVTTRPYFRQRKHYIFNIDKNLNS